MALIPPRPPSPSCPRARRTKSSRRPPPWRTRCTGSRGAFRRRADRRAAEADRDRRALGPIGDLARRHHGAGVFLARDVDRHVEIDLLAPSHHFMINQDATTLHPTPQVSYLPDRLLSAVAYLPAIRCRSAPIDPGALAGC